MTPYPYAFTTLDEFLADFRVATKGTQEWMVRDWLNSDGDAPDGCVYLAGSLAGCDMSECAQVVRLPKGMMSDEELSFCNGYEGWRKGTIYDYNHAEPWPSQYEEETMSRLLDLIVELSK